eukprot:TRINITY_DN10655_c0_g2_i1.p1 TRINITY_DN10655_c0_g2~~TRINITY_DN10655_c0_g2_i1.p1  ORF type:complete len:121 (-),score=16.40 TRINITY_DN10655_c0_g2_i1:236-598(-)
MLPLDVWLEIIEYVGPVDLPNLLRTNKQLASLNQKPEFWRKISARFLLFPHSGSANSWNEFRSLIIHQLGWDPHASSTPDFSDRGQVKELVRVVKRSSDFRFFRSSDLLRIKSFSTSTIR